MLDHEYTSLISSVIDSKVLNEELFTAFDVSLEVKSKCAAANLKPLRHGEMKSAIHEYLMYQYVSAGLYNRKIHDVGAPEKAFLYYPLNADPNMYVSMDRSKFDQPQTVTQPTVPGDGLPWNTPGFAAPNNPGVSTTRKIQTAKDIAEFGMKPDQRKAIRVPVLMAKQIGLQVGDRAYVGKEMVDGVPSLVITKEARPCMVSYSVHPGNSFAISYGTLYDSGLVADAYDLTIGQYDSQTAILVKAH